MSSTIKPPFDVYGDIDGKPLDAGYIYIGESGQNPITNPLNVFFDKELTIPASQPIRTVNGFPSNNGSASNIFISEDDYSITVQNKKQTLVYSSTSAVSSFGTGGVNVKDFGAKGDGSTDDYQAIQNAINSFGSNGGELYFPTGDYNISYPLILPPIGAIQLVGENRNTSRIIKTNTTPASGTTARVIPGASPSTETFDVDAVLICDHGDDSYYFGLVIRGMSLVADDASTGYAVYAPRLAQSYIEMSIFTNGGQAFGTKDCWNSRFDRCDFQNAEYGWRVEPDTSTAGTSLTFTTCYANGNKFGFYFSGTIYSSLNSCAVDNTEAGGAAYYFGSNAGTECTMSAISCGTENTVGRHFIVEDSVVNFIGGAFGEADGIETLPSTFYTETMLVNGTSYVTMRGTSHFPKNVNDNTLTIADTSQLLQEKTAILGGSLGSSSLSVSVASGSSAMRFENEFFDGQISAGSVQTIQRGFAYQGAAYMEFANSGAGVANQLDYYAEGSWTPACADFTPTIFGASYTRIGDQVTVSARIDFGAYGGGSGASAAVITGLPFAYGADNYAVGSTVNNNNSHALGISVSAGTASSASQLVLYRPDSGNITPLTNDEVANHTFYISYSYKAA